MRKQEFMKLHVFRNRLQMIVTLMFFLDFPSAASSQQIAECTKPPGGKVTCEKGQLARCAVNKEGEVDGSCKTPPPKMTSDEIKAWTLSEVLGKRVHIEDLQKDEYKT